MDPGRRFRIRKWGALGQIVVRREGVGMCRTGSRGAIFDGLVGLGIQIYTTIGYASFGLIRFTC